LALNESGKRPAVQGIRRAAPAVPVDDKAGVAGVGLEEALDCWEQLEAQGIGAEVFEVVGGQRHLVLAQDAPWPA
jgi:hypothetical protein